MSRLIAVLKDAVECRCRPNIDDLDAQNILFMLEELTAERDAALAEVKTLSKNIGEFADRTTNEIRGLRSTLREAKEALTPYMKFVDGTQVKNHPAKVYERINKVLGDE